MVGSDNVNIERKYNIMNKKIRILLVISLALFSLSLIAFPAFAADDEPSLNIHTYNLSYSESIYLAYAVKSENLDMTETSVKMLFWSTPVESYTINTAEYISPAADITEVKGVPSAVIFSNGIAPKNLTDIVYARAYAEVDGKAVGGKAVDLLRTLQDYLLNEFLEQTTV